MRLLFLLSFCFVFSIFCMAQDAAPQKVVIAKRTDASIVIDGKLDESAWSQASVATDFIQFEPEPGGSPMFSTTVKILYDDAAIYVGALMLDDQPQEIRKELRDRDDFGNIDWFGIFLNPYQDGINGVSFIMSPRSVQMDAQYSTENGEDFNWDAVWDGKAKITSEGWIAEFKIPYSAIRFPTSDIQSWNINFGRLIRRTREKSFWNEVNPEIDGFLNQSGVIEGIQDIESPVRLQATPFVAYEVENYRDINETPTSSWGTSFSGGMDVKYGINDAFTLDMTLVPDFSQARSDNQVLNLSPFEVFFNENRPFFTEGVELFNKGNLFYSRRVGGVPLRFYDVEDMLEEGEEIIENPQRDQLINATKVSGRTDQGLGIGVFNAVSAGSHARIQKADGGEREIQTSPLTNYSVLSLDQNLKNNSYITLVNTNVLRSGTDYDANVTGIFYRVRNKKNSMEVEGSGVVSQKYFSAEDDMSTVDLGHKYNIGVGKISGNFNWRMGYFEESYNYDPNDLGFLFSPNDRAFTASMNYNIYKPFGGFNRMFSGIFFRYGRLHQPNVFNSIWTEVWLDMQTKGFVFFGVWAGLSPVEGNDYFEPRTEDFSRHFVVPVHHNFGGFVSTDYRKPVAVDINANFWRAKEDSRGASRQQYRWNIRPRWRVSDHLNLVLSTGSSHQLSDVGYVDEVDEDIVFGRRNRIDVENQLTVNYTFNNRMNVSFRTRHYWSQVNYLSYHILQEDGTLKKTDYNDDLDGRFDAFNIDMIYRWRFAPGSDIFVVWKNTVVDSRDGISDGYFDDLNGLFDLPTRNNFSVKILYFLDYLNFRKKRTNKTATEK